MKVEVTKMKTKEQIKAKMEALKTDFIEELAYKDDERALYQVAYKTLQWVLSDDNVVKIKCRGRDL